MKNYSKQIAGMIEPDKNKQKEFIKAAEDYFLGKDVIEEKGTVIWSSTPNGKNYFYEDWKKTNGK